ncbi:TolC family protein [Melioribacteraceae bacterium 4301-Me]|uniref:TolC family protein n=1 Tax=Pyranulibacter aquaticus TaxID=3163344 RepID=UPI00359A46A3
MRKFIIMCYLLSVSLTAQNHKILTLKESLILGIENSKELKIARSKINALEAKVSEVNSQLLPQIKFQASYQRLSSIPPFEVSVPFLPLPIQISPTILDNFNLKLSLQQPLFTGFRLWSLKSIAENNYKAETYDYQKEINEVALKIQTAFWNYYKAKQLKRLIEENLKQTQRHLDDTKNYLANQLATKNDVLKLEVLYSNIKLQLIEAENNIDITRSSFNKILGLPLEVETDINVETIDTSFISYKLDELINRSKEKRNELKSLQYQVNASNKAIVSANSGWYPSIYLMGNYYYSKPNPRIFPAQNKFKDTWDVGVILQWDIWNWGYTSSLAAQAEEQKIQAQTALSQLKDAVELEVYQAYLSYNKAAEKIKVSRITVEQADENYKTIQEKYNQQLATSTDLIDAEVSLLQAKTNLTTSLVDFQLAKVVLLKAVGEKIY